MTMSCSGSDFPDPACLSRPSGNVRAYPGCAAPPNSGAAWCLHHRQEAPAPAGLILGDAVMCAATATHRDLQRDRNRPHSPPAGSRRLPARCAHLRLPDSAHSLQRLPGRCGPHRGPGDQHPQPAHRQPRARARAGAGERSGVNQGPDGPAHRRARPHRAGDIGASLRGWRRRAIPARQLTTVTFGHVSARSTGRGVIKPYGRRSGGSACLRTPDQAELSALPARRLCASRHADSSFG